MRTFQGSGRNSTLARALGEYGRIGKTLHLLDLADDELYRRSLLIQVNKGERRHGLARTVFHGAPLGGTRTESRSTNWSASRAGNSRVAHAKLFSPRIGRMRDFT
jgi:TnpA family transposase